MHYGFIATLGLIMPHDSRAWRKEAEKRLKLALHGRAGIQERLICNKVQTPASCCMCSAVRLEGMS